MTTQLKKHGILDVLGYRSPFLQSSGDPTLSVLKDHGFLYDSSMPTKEGQLWWPYTLEYKFPPRECVVEPCPKSMFLFMLITIICQKILYRAVDCRGYKLTGFLTPTLNTSTGVLS